MQAKLTAHLVRRLTEELPPPGDTVIFDIRLPRFALRLKPPRSRGRPWASLYFIRYTLAGQERRMKVGDPRTMSLDDARRAARFQLAIVDRGGDPAAERRAQREAWTVQQAVEDYCASNQFTGRSAKG
jgi:hypothetical protein